MKFGVRFAAIVGAALAVGLVWAGAAIAAKPAWSPVAVTVPTNLPPVQSEIQKISVDAEGGTYTLTFKGQTSSPIAFDADASTVEDMLNGLSSIGGAGGTVEVQGGPGNNEAEHPYTVLFGGTLGNTNVESLSANSTLLTGGSSHLASVTTVVEGGPGTTTLVLRLQNIGGFSSLGTISYKAVLPPGITTTSVAGGEGWSCPLAVGLTEFTCTSSKVVGPSLTQSSIKVELTPALGAESGVVEVEASGGGGVLAQSEMPLTVSSAPAEPGIQTFVAGAYDSNGNLDTQAGDHPYSASAAIFVNTIRTSRGSVVPAGEFRDISVDLPPGFLGNPIAVPQCPESTEANKCSLDSMVAVVAPVTQATEGGAGAAVMNTEAPLGYPAKFRFIISGLEPLNVVGSLRSDSDYGITTASLNTPQILAVYGTYFTFWGAPADPSHDEQRCIFPSNHGQCSVSHSGNTAFLTNATNCAEQAAAAPITTLNSTLWQFPGQIFTKQVTIPPVTGCDKLHFEDNFTFEPSNTKADSTASFKTSLTVPSEGLTTPSKLTTPELKDMVVKLPKGVVLNASGADGLEACSLDQIGYLGGDFPMPNPMHFNHDPNTCPEASKIGTGELKSALLEEPLHGALYLAAQGKGNPFGSLFAIYLVIEDPRHGIFIKLPGEVEPSEADGQMQVTFQNLPQLPFTSLNLNLKGGDRAALASPTTCGTYTTTATGTPWSAPESGPPTVTGQSFEINEGPDGGPCAQTPQERPFNIGWEAGSDSTNAGASAPFNFRITRPDGSQEIETLELKTAPGVSASLKGIPYCSEAQIERAEKSTGKEEQENPACPAASQVGTLTTGAGSGPSPFFVTGKLYLAGPYKGAPLSVVAITPAVAGPFDLGNVVVRNAVFINRGTAQVSAKSDPIPQILKGVVLRIKDVRIHLNHEKWAINPTSCDPSSVDLTTKGNSGAIAEKSARFQVGGCQDLSFGPKLKGALTGPTRRGGLPAFTAEVTFPEGQANTKDVRVTLPHSEFLEQAHIDTICTRPQAAAHECPAGSIYGYAEAETPLLDGKLTGPVFLKSSEHKLPDLAIFLKGPENQPVEVEFAGRIDSVKGQIRDTIEGLPDVPVSRFVLKMKGGKKGLLTNSRNLCASKVTKMTVRLVGQNNKVSRYRPPLTRDCTSAKRTKRGPAKRAKVSSIFGIW